MIRYEKNIMGSYFSSLEIRALKLAEQKMRQSFTAGNTRIKKQLLRIKKCYDVADYLFDEIAENIKAAIEGDEEAQIEALCALYDIGISNRSALKLAENIRKNKFSYYNMREIEKALNLPPEEELEKIIEEIRKNPDNFHKTQFERNIIYREFNVSLDLVRDITENYQNQEMQRVQKQQAEQLEMLR